MSTPAAPVPGAQSPHEPASSWARGGITFALVVLVLIGGFEIIVGLAAIIKDQFYVVTPNYAYKIDTTAWGWIHLILGIIMVLAGWGLYSRRSWAGITAIVLASLSALANFFFIPYYPFWSLLLIALNIWVIWALTRPGVLRS